jgi:predicted lysophospholipase L1 biosynthesis ABC-type transport system permease subunit
VAVVVAVASVTTVGFFADRVHQALSRQANQLLGADLVISGDRALDASFAAEAERRGLKVARMLRFPSMTAGGGQNVLAEVKVVTAGYPLRGDLRIADVQNGTDRRATEIPKAGTVWVDERLMTRLQLQVGDVIEIGKSRLPVAQIITQEPDSAIGFINAGPRVMLNDADVAATELVQVGSRVRYRVLVAGAPAAIADYRGWVTPKLAPGQRVESIEDARPEIRSALERSEKFLSLAALLSVVLAAVPARSCAATGPASRVWCGSICSSLSCLALRQVSPVVLPDSSPSMPWRYGWAVWSLLNYLSPDGCRHCTALSLVSHCCWDLPCHRLLRWRGCRPCVCCAGTSAHRAAWACWVMPWARW